MIKKTKTRPEFFELSNFRRRFTILVLLTLFLTLFFKTLYLQSIQRDFLQAKGGNYSNRNQILHAFRGKILDRNGELLAASSPVERIEVNLSKLIINKDQKKRLSLLLKIDKAHLNSRLSKKGKNTVYLKRSVPPEIALSLIHI